MSLLISGDLRLRKEFQWNETVWNPSMISTALWLDAADASTVTMVSGAVSQWNDKSGNARNAAQSTPASRPILVSNEINSRPVVRFNSSLMTGNRALSAPGNSVFIIAKAAAQINTPLFTQHPGTADLGRCTWGTGVSPNQGKFNHFFNNGTSFLATSTTTAFDSTPHLMYAQATAAGTHVVRIDAGSEEGTVTGQIHTPMNTPYTLGAVGGGFNAISNGDIAELIVLSSPASTDTRQKTEGYLAHKWGLTANLPNDHPYKTVGPTV